MIYALLFFISSVNWYSMYVKDEKVGYSQIVQEKTPSGYKVSELTNIELQMMGAKRWLKSIAQYEVTPEFELQNFTFELQTEAQRILMRGAIEVPEKGFGCACKTRRLKFSIKTGGTTQTKVIEAKSPVYPATVLPMLITKFSDEAEGDKSPCYKEVDVFDPSIQAINTAKLRLLRDFIPRNDTGRYKLLETQADSIKAEVQVLGANSVLWIRQDGVLLSQQQPMGIFMKRESREEALKIGEVGPEVLTLYGIRPKKKIENPRNVKLLKLLVKGEFPESIRQQRLGDTLLLQKIGPTMGRSINKYLEPTPFIQCRDKRIVNLSKEIIGESRDSWKKAKKLVEWTADNIHDMPTVTIPSALDVLETREGDCGEHAVLFVALARACGIPAQIVVGLAYVGDGFYYHAWAKIWAGRWVELDPTFRQTIADATHIALAEGELEEQAKIMKLVDEIELEVLEYK